MSFSATTLVYALLGGLVPALIWLYFLLKEDARCPEPRHVILIAFGAGMLAIPLSLPLEHFAITYLPATVPGPGLHVLFAWASIEEIMKYALAAILVLWRREVNESIDFIIYMITVALGFAAVENILFLIGPLSEGHLSAGIITENLRFVGSTLVHIICSAIIGFALGLTFTSTRLVKTTAIITGLILAITLHTVFNFLIILKDGSHTVFAFITVWTGTIIFLGLFEILKYFRYRRLPKNTC